MQQSVTAIVVARNGATELERTLAALASQSRTPDAVVVLGIGSGEATKKVAANAGTTQFLTTDRRVNFPQALAAAVRSLSLNNSDGDDSALLWLLAEDCAPEPEALACLLAVIETSPSVALAGPKLVEWDDPQRIRELGISVTRFGATVPLVDNELDQAQHDARSDVLGVSASGALVRYSVWQQLGGLDPELPDVDSGLDFSIRARLVGHRVVLAPAARVALGDSGISVPRRFTRSGMPRANVRARRSAQLHRRLVYASGFALMWHWLSLVPLGIARSIVRVLAKQPGAVSGELSAAFRVAFGGGTRRARVQLSRKHKPDWSVIAPLRLPLSEVRQRRALRREELLTGRRSGEELGFWGAGGWVTLAVLVLSVVAWAPLLGTGTIGGGGILPLGSLGTLWSEIGYGWLNAGAGAVGAADPFTGVLAVLGSLTFWNPSLSLLLLWFAAMPLAALGAWMLAARFTPRTSARVFFALAWALAPPLLTALQAGRPAAVVAHLLLPWLGHAAWRARHSWAASAATALLGAGVVAASPSLAPALVLLWLAWVVGSGRDVLRTIGVPIPAIVLFLPLVLGQLSAGRPLALLADPGVPQPSATPTPWEIVLANPGSVRGASGALGWNPVNDWLHLGALAPVIAAVLMAPIAALALASLFALKNLRAALFMLAGLTGLASAILLAGSGVISTGDSSVSLWTGSQLSLYWLGLTAAAALGVETVRRAAPLSTLVASLTLAASVTPLGLALILNRSLISATASGTLPAYVAAQAASHPQIGTVSLSVNGDGAFIASYVRGVGTTLDEQSTLVASQSGIGTGTGVNNERELAELTANITTPSGLNAEPLLSSLGVGFIFLDSSSQPTDSQQATLSRAGVSLSSNPLFNEVGTTSDGTLWSVTGSGAKFTTAHVRLNSTQDLWRGVVRIGFIVVFGVALLLALPTGRMAELERRAAVQARKQRRAQAAASAAAMTMTTTAGSTPVAAASGPAASLGTDAGAAASTTVVAVDPEAPELREAPETSPDPSTSFAESVEQPNPADWSVSSVSIPFSESLDPAVSPDFESISSSVALAREEAAQARLPDEPESEAESETESGSEPEPDTTLRVTGDAPWPESSSPSEPQQVEQSSLTQRSSVPPESWEEPASDVTLRVRGVPISAPPMSPRLASALSMSSTSMGFDLPRIAPVVAAGRVTPANWAPQASQAPQIDQGPQNGQSIPGDELPDSDSSGEGDAEAGVATTRDIEEGGGDEY